jgi:putative acetyltransferase
MTEDRATPTVRNGMPSAAPAPPRRPAPPTVTFAPADPLAPDLAELHRLHHAAMHADTPPGSIHMLSAQALAAPGIAFFALRDATGRPLGMAALKRLDRGHAELKSMHLLAEMRGRGLARLLLDRLLVEARCAGFRRISLETGSQASFAAARRLYAAAGFLPCPPYADYRPDPMSVFMTLALAPTPPDHRP